VCMWERCPLFVSSDRDWEREREGRWCFASPVSLMCMWFGQSDKLVKQVGR
jgi:hypothetical protein